jgi:hypothetical protein
LIKRTSSDLSSVSAAEAKKRNKRCKRLPVVSSHAANTSPA